MGAFLFLKPIMGEDMKKRGFTLVELMVVVAIIAVLAAIAVPIYAKLRQRSMVSSCLRECMGATSGLQAWYQEEGTFTGLTMVGPGSGGRIVDADSETIGVNLPSLVDTLWSISTANVNQLDVQWVFTSTRCPGSVCNGRYCLRCDSDDGVCTAAVSVSDASLGFNKATPGVSCTPP